MHRDLMTDNVRTSASRGTMTVDIIGTLLIGMVCLSRSQGALTHDIGSNLVDMTAFSATEGARQVLRDLRTEKFRTPASHGTMTIDIQIFPLEMSVSQQTKMQ